MDKPQLAPHEAMEIHELLNFKTVCLAKSKALDGLVTDKSLKALIQQDLQQSMTAIEQLEQLYTRRDMVQ